MAIRLLQSSVIANYEVTAANTFHAGDGLIFDSAVVQGVKKPVTSTNVTTATFAGLALGDHLTTSNTFIQNDPVGSSVVSADGSTFTSYANGFFVGVKRAIGDWQDETASVVSNLTDTGPTPHRGIGVARQHGTQFITDRIKTGQTWTAGTTWGISDASTTEGLLDALVADGGGVIGHTDYYDSTAGLLFGTITA